MGHDDTAARSAAAATEGADEMFGVWNLDVRTPFGQQPATLTLRRGPAGEPEGDIVSQLGNAALTRIELRPGGFDAAVTLGLQGRDYDARLSAEVSGAQVSGTIKVNIPIAPPLKFTGTR